MTTTASTSKSMATPGTQVVALYNYAGGATKGDLRFAKGQLLHVKGAVTADSNWLRARSSDGREGLIPINYVRPYSPGRQPNGRPPSANGVGVNHKLTLGSQVWYHGHITRDRAETLLTSKADGTFLVRDSTNFPGDYTLCLTHRGKVDHYRVYNREEGTIYTCDDEEFFETLSQLIAHYKRDADGLSNRLVAPLPHAATPMTPQSSLALDLDIPDGAPHTKGLHRSPNTRVVNGDATTTTPNDGHHLSIVDAHMRMFRQNGWAISRNDIHLGETIGHGEFGDVLLGLFKGQEVAVKCLKQTSGVVASLLEEAMLMQSLKHPNLVALLGVVLDDITNIYLVTEYMAEGNLVDYVRSRGRHALHGGQLFTFAMDVCAGMAYLEQRQLVHRDLAARNILLDANLKAAIADFGLAKHQDTCATDAMSGKFPIKWTSPEALRHSKFSNKSDMWSFAVLLWEIYSFGRVPYPRIPIQDVVRHIERGYRMEPPERCPPPVARLMAQAWAIDVDDRPTFARMLTVMKEIEEEMTDPSNTPSNEGAVLPTTSPPPAPRSNGMVKITTSRTSDSSDGEYDVTIDRP